MNARARWALLRAALALAAACTFLTAGPAQADTAVCKQIVAGLNSLHSYHAVISMTIGGKPYVTTMDIEKPNKYHVTQPGMEVIYVGTSGWQRPTGEAWKPAPAMPVDLTAAATDIFGKGDWNCTSAGAGAWQGQPARIYKVTGTRSVGEKRIPTAETIYMLGDGYVHHVVVNSGSDPPWTMDFTELNTATVTAPK
jgi:hypothetical protein